MTWENFLDQLLNPYIQAAVGILWFVFWEYLPEALKVLGISTAWLENLDSFPKAKRVVVGVFCLAVPVTAYMLKVFTLGVPFVWDGTMFNLGQTGLWYAIWAGAMSFSSSTGLHTIKLKT
jgi:hypothetical protein